MWELESVLCELGPCWSFALSLEHRPSPERVLVLHGKPTSPVPVSSGTKRVLSNTEAAVLGSSGSQGTLLPNILGEHCLTAGGCQGWAPLSAPASFSAVYRRYPVPWQRGQTDPRHILEGVCQETWVWIQAAWPQTCHLTSLCLVFPTCKMGAANSHHAGW